MDGFYGFYLGSVFAAADSLYSRYWVMKIPNRLTATFIIAGIVYQSVMFGMSGGIQSVLGAAAGFMPLLVLYVLKGIGAGMSNCSLHLELGSALHQ